MLRVLENIIGMLVYSAVYLVIAIVSLKVIGAAISPSIEKKIVEENNVGLAIIVSCSFIGLAILLSSVIR